MIFVIGLLFGSGLLLIVAVFDGQVPARTVKLRNPFKGATMMRTVSHEVWPEVVDDLASAIRAGMSLPQAIEEISVSGPIELREPFLICVRNYRASGDFVSSLYGIAEYCRQASADKFVSALQIAYAVGGADLGVVLRTLSEVLRDDIKVRSEIAARQSWTVNGARLAVAAPWITALVLSVHGEAARVYASPAGIRILGMCAFVSTIAYLVMMAIGRLPREPRVLA